MLGTDAVENQEGTEEPSWQASSTGKASERIVPMTGFERWPSLLGQ